MYFSLQFCQNVEITKVLSALENAAAPGGEGFGDFEVDSGSIQTVSVDELPTDPFIGTTESPIGTNDPTGKEELLLTATVFLSLLHINITAVR